MKRKTINMDLIDTISESAAHKKNDTEIKKSINKTKTITYPEFWESKLFDESIKNKSFSGTWQAFIREAIREKMLNLNIDINQL